MTTSSAAVTASHTAGTIGAAGNNGVGITGVAQNVRIMPLRVCAHSASDDDARCPSSSEIAAINYAGAHGARVANMSLGGDRRRRAMRDAIAANPGVLFVISAGNDAATTTGGTPHYPCDYDPSTSGIAGAIDNVICVAAIDQADEPRELLRLRRDARSTSARRAPRSSARSRHEVLFARRLRGHTRVDGDDRGGFATGAKRRPADDQRPQRLAGRARRWRADVSRVDVRGHLDPGRLGRVHAQRRQRFVRLERRHVQLRDAQRRRPIFLNSPVGSCGQRSLVSFHTVPITGLGGQTVQIRFTYTTGATPTANDGVWLDNIVFDCIHRGRQRRPATGSSRAPRWPPRT